MDIFHISFYPRITSGMHKNRVLLLEITVKMQICRHENRIMKMTVEWSLKSPPDQINSMVWYSLYGRTNDSIF